MVVLICFHFLLLQCSKKDATMILCATHWLHCPFVLLFNNTNFLFVVIAEGLGILKDFPHSAFNNFDRKVIKTEPEDTR